MLWSMRYITALVSTKQILDMADVELVLDYFGIRKGNLNEWVSP